MRYLVAYEGWGDILVEADSEHEALNEATRIITELPLSDWPCAHTRATVHAGKPLGRHVQGEPRRALAKAASA